MPTNCPGPWDRAKKNFPLSSGSSGAAVFQLVGGEASPGGYGKGEPLAGKTFPLVTGPSGGHRIGPAGYSGLLLL